MCGCRCVIRFCGQRVRFSDGRKVSRRCEKKLSAMYLAVDLNNIEAKKIYPNIGLVGRPAESKYNFYKMRLSLDKIV